jgi:fumarylacetoacetate (FAA) hydrolase family protein
VWRAASMPLTGEPQQLDERMTLNTVQTMKEFLPDDGCAGTLLARVWNPNGPFPGPMVVAVRAAGLFDVTEKWPTVADVLDEPNPAAALNDMGGTFVATVGEALANSALPASDSVLRFLAPVDVQVIKACGVTFADSMLERVIEERTKGDASGAGAVRAEITAVIGDNLQGLKPGSAPAMALKEVLKAKGWWSAYLEVGIGPDAEVFTKAPVMGAVGPGALVGIRSDSSWNNPEPEVVLAVNARGETVGVSLGNDVNLRDIEGRSALLLGKAKDNNASCAIGPFIRLFDATFGMDDVRKMTLDLQVAGDDGYALQGENQMSRISRDPLDLVAQTISAHHYPDGFMLFTGTLFAPTKDRDAPGAGFTHHVGDVVRIRNGWLGELCNQVTHAETAPPWHFGVRALMRNLAQRGLLG